jgi:hypothetical protein
MFLLNVNLEGFSDVKMIFFIAQSWCRTLPTKNNIQVVNNFLFLVQGSSPPLASLTDTLGIDIAGRLRSHFLANLPSQSYAWLNSMSGAAPPHPHPRGGGGRSEGGRHSSGGGPDAANKLEKHPLLCFLMEQR